MQTPSYQFGSAAVVGTRGVSVWPVRAGVAEKARTRGFAAPAFAGGAFVEGGCPTYERGRALSAYTFCQGTWGRQERRRGGGEDPWRCDPAFVGPQRVRPNINHAWWLAQSGYSSVIAS